MTEKKRRTVKSNLNATVAKMHAVYGKRLKQEDFAALLSCTSVSDAAGYLKRSTYFSRTLEGIDTDTIHRGNLENLLRRSVIENYFRIIDFENIFTDEFYNYMFIKTEIDEILICIQHLNAGSEDHITTLPIYMNKYTSFNLMELAQVRSFDELLELIERTPYYDILKDQAPAAGENGNKTMADIPRCELKLRTYYFNRLLDSLESFGSDARKRIKRYITSQIDMINIINAYRMKRYFNADKEEIKARMIPIYERIPEKILDGLYGAMGEKEFIERLSKTCYGREISDAGFDIKNPEAALMRLRHKTTKRTFSRSRTAPESFITFNTLAETEVKNIIRIIEGIRYSLPVKEMSELLIG